MERALLSYREATLYALAARLTPLPVTKLSQPVPRSTPLPSYAILAIGGLSLVCLGLLAVVAWNVEQTTAPPLHLDGPGASSTPPPEPIEPLPLEEPTHTSAFDTEPQRIPNDLVIDLELAAEETIDVELDRYFEAVLHGFGESSAQIEPTLPTYAARLAGRLNAQSVSYHIEVTAPDSALAAARAESLRRLFEAKGVVSERLLFTAERGAPGLTVVPT